MQYVDLKDIHKKIDQTEMKLSNYQPSPRDLDSTSHLTYKHALDSLTVKSKDTCSILNIEKSQNEVDLNYVKVAKIFENNVASLQLAINALPKS